MTDQTAIEREAIELGWVPKEKFKGNEENFVEAEEFVARGKQMIPLIRAQNTRLQNQLQTVAGESAQLKEQLASAQEAIEALKDMNTAATLKDAKDTRKQLLTAKRQAEKEENDEQVIALEEQIEETNTAIREAEAKKGKKVEVTKPAESSQPAPVVDPKDPQVVAWMDENPWWGTDEDRSDYALSVGNRLVRQKGLKGRALLDAVKEVVLARMPLEDVEVDEPKAKGKLEGNRSSNNGGGGSLGGKKKRGYAELPADAKAGAALFEKKLVGPGKAFKTVAEYQQNYAEKYWSGEEE